MSGKNPGSRRSGSNFNRRRRGGDTFFVASGLVILAILGAYIALDLSGHRIEIAQGSVEISSKSR
jgi:hypothetical protein